MFCDLVGSTSLAATLDAEDWRTLVNAYLDEASAAVTGFGGHVLKKLGDGLMTLFGYPQAQENDAERAVRAALAIQRALADLNARNIGQRRARNFQARIGLDSGQVVVDATGEVFGEAPNVAARVQAAAEPGTVFITASVQRQTAGLFVVEDKGFMTSRALTGAGRALPRRAGERRRPTGRAGADAAGRPRGRAFGAADAPLVARSREGEGQFVQIVGEPGIGKSRPDRGISRKTRSETPHTWVEWAAVAAPAEHAPAPSSPNGAELRFGGLRRAADEGRLADLENTLHVSLVKLDVRTEYGGALIAPLVDIPLPEESVRRNSRRRNCVDGNSPR